MANKLYAQYAPKPKITSWSNIPKDLAQDVIDAASAISESYRIDINSGEQLNIIGRIVGRDRGFINTINLTVFECNSVGEFECGDSLSQCSSPTVAEDAELSDEYYRYFLRSKIAKNNTDASIDGILTVLNEAIPGLIAARLIDGENMTFHIEFDGSISSLVRDFMVSGDICPRPTGVKFDGFLSTLGMVVCNDSGEFECGDSSAECIGYLGT